MNNIVSLDEAKKHLNVGFEEDDEYISTLICVASERIESHIDKKFEEFNEILFCFSAFHIHSPP